MNLSGFDVIMPPPQACAPRPGRRDDDPLVPESLDQRNSAASRWAQSDNAFWGVTMSHEILPAGRYRCEIIDGKPVLKKQIVSTDKLIRLPDSASDEVVEEIRSFRKLREKFAALGFLHKRGIFLHGPAGSGKTVTVEQICDLIVAQEGGVALYSDHPVLTASCLQLLRRIEPERPALVIMEDMDTLIDRWGENEYLALLDGEAQVDSVTFVATSNYPEKLDKRFLDRPSRFDTIRYIGMPSAAARRTYLEAKVPYLADEDRDEMITGSEGLSIAHLRELVILTQCFGLPVEVALKRLVAMKQTPDSDRNPQWKAPGFEP